MIFTKNVVKVKCIMAAWCRELYSYFQQKLCFGKNFIKMNYLSVHQGITWWGQGPVDLTRDFLSLRGKGNQNERAERDEYSPLSPL
jgi:hypothetical protein